MDNVRFGPDPTIELQAAKERLSERLKEKLARDIATALMGGKVRKDESEQCWDGNRVSIPSATEADRLMLQDMMKNQ